MNLTKRLAVLATLTTLMLLTVSMPASAAVDDAVDDSRLVAINGPYSCTRIGPNQYSCYGVDGACLVYWYDDDANGNPHDKNATITQIYCAMFRTMIGLETAAV